MLLFTLIALTLTTLPILTQAQTYTTVSCASNKTEAFCGLHISNSCCATASTVSISKTNAKTTTTAYYCLPIDLVTSMAKVDVNSTLYYQYTCNNLISTPSDNCTSGATACATLQNTCCATRKVSINNEALNTTVSSVCSLTSFVNANTVYNGTTASAKISVASACLDSVTY